MKVFAHSIKVIGYFVFCGWTELWDLDSPTQASLASYSAKWHLSVKE